MKPSATIIADSISPDGFRVTTLEVTLHRFVLAEMNTHRVFSRNSASSRAIPIKKQIQKVLDDPAYPLEWGLNQAGMQAGELISEDEALLAQECWDIARDNAVRAVEHLQKIGVDSAGELKGVHKQIANRLLEPFMWHTMIITSGDFTGLFLQRCSPLAQPEIRVAAEAMRDAIFQSEPTLLSYEDWHTPYVDPGEIVDLEDRKKVSAARSARVSYLTQNGIRDYKEDIAMYGRLTSADPPHYSPLEHVAKPARLAEKPLGNIPGWHQLRHLYNER